MRQGQRHGAQHHGARGHQDGTQAQHAGLGHGLEQFPALVAQLIGEFDDQDAVLGDQAHQRDEPDLAVDRQRAATQPQRQQRAGHGQRHRQHDDEGIAPAFELRRQHQVDEGQRHGEHQVNAARGIAELARLAVQVGHHRGRQHLARHLVHVRQHLAQRVARRHRAVDLHGAQAVEVVQRLRRHAFVHAQQIVELHHAAVARPHVNARDVRGIGASRGVTCTITSYCSPSSL